METKKIETVDATNNIMHPTEKKGKKEQKVSISYTLKAISEHIKKLHENGFITDEEAATMKTVHKSAVQKYMQKELGA